MNRFIRTKDGEVFELLGQEKRLYGDFISIDHKHYRYDCVIKQADRLEELCDVFIKKSKEPGNNYFVIGDDPFYICDIKFEAYKKLMDVYDYYGAIWTKDGIKFVAKLNKEGVLDLI